MDEQLPNKINTIAEGDYLQCTCTMWMDQTWDLPIQEEVKDPKVTVHIGQAFPYLDMELHWNDKGKLNYRVHLKPNQQLKYLNRSSTHTNPCFKAIPHGV